MRRFKVLLGLLNIAFDLSRTLYHGFFSRPDLLEVSKLTLHLINLLVEQLNLLDGSFGGVFLDTSRSILS